VGEDWFSVSIFENICDVPAKKTEDRLSRAVIASDGKNGAVVFHIGEHIKEDLTHLGYSLSDLGLDSAPRGISIWEGCWAGGGYDSYNGDYFDIYLVGKFRQPTDDEWICIKEGRCPWAEYPIEDGVVDDQKINEIGF
jgi:hypothetical protein